MVTNGFPPQLMRTHMYQPLWDYVSGQQPKLPFLMLYIFRYLSCRASKEIMKNDQTQEDLFLEDIFDWEH